jgi:hypothetical protein
MRVDLTSCLYEGAVFIKKIIAVHQVRCGQIACHAYLCCAKYIYYSQIIIIFN